MFIVYECDTLTMSRIVEQAVLVVCLTNSITQVVFGQFPSNRINGIAPKNNKNAINALKKDKKAFEKTLDLLSCTSDSDIKLARNM